MQFSVGPSRFVRVAISSWNRFPALCTTNQPPTRKLGTIASPSPSLLMGSTVHLTGSRQTASVPPNSPESSPRLEHINWQLPLPSSPVGRGPTSHEVPRPFALIFAIPFAREMEESHEIGDEFALYESGEVHTSVMRARELTWGRHRVTGRYDPA